ncbi:hypothetical protein DITRI_Ditri09bG0113700 [Diplodiscus trichospermus]
MENGKTPERKPQVRVPPKRGQVKVQMFKQLAKKVMSFVKYGKHKVVAMESSASTAPLSSSCYTSEGNSDA